MKGSITIDFPGKGVLYSHSITMTNYTNTYSPSLLAGPSGIHVRWGIETNGRFEAVKAPNFSWATLGWASCFFVPPALLV